MAGPSGIPSSGSGSGSLTLPPGVNTSPGANQPKVPKPRLPLPKVSGPPKPTQPAGPKAPKQPNKPGKPAAPAKPPDWLAPRTQASLVSQATSQMTKAYAPSFANLSQQQKQATGIADKRAADDRYYQTWLATQGAALQSHAAAADQALQQQEQQLSAQQQQLYANQPGQLAAAANARPGNVSNNAQSNMFGGVLQGQQQANEGMLGAAQQQAAAGGINQMNQVTGAALNDAASLQAMRTKQLSDFQTVMTGIANQRSKLQLTQGADISKEITRLQGVEISKAQADRNFLATEQKLGISQANNIRTTSTSAANNARTNATSSANNALTNATSAANNQRTTAQQNIDNIRTTNQQNIDNLRSTQTSAANNAANNAVRLALAAGKGGAKLYTPSQKLAIRKSIDTMTGNLNTLMTAMSPQAAYHKLQNGGYITVGTSRIHIAPAGNIQLLNAAYNLRNGGSGLTPGDVAALGGSANVQYLGYRVQNITLPQKAP